MNDTANLIAVNAWTPEDFAIICQRRRSLPNRADEAFGDKCDALRMLLLARADRYCGEDETAGERHARLAFGGLAPSEIQAPTIVYHQLGFGTVCACGDRECNIGLAVKLLAEERAERDKRCKHGVHFEWNVCGDCMAEEFAGDVPASERVRRCQVDLLPGNPPAGHELLPAFICDAKTTYGPWAWLCPACAATFGVGSLFSTGKGQRFVNDSSMRKIEG